jgi:hypothetical protein
MVQIPWYKSKIVILMILMTLLGGIPLVGDFLKGFAINPEVIEHAVTMILGLITIVIRIWFTNTTIATPPPVE